MMTDGSPKEVWLIGAGASRSETEGHFPCLIDLPARARTLGLIPPDDDKDGGFHQLSRFLRDKYYGDISRDDVRIDLESVLTLLEIDLAIAPVPRLLLVRDHILLLLRQTIGKLHRQKFTCRGEYQKMIRMLTERDSIISFNWDLLLDDALERQARLKIPAGTDTPQLWLDNNLYGRMLLDFSGWGERSTQRLGTQPPTHDRSTNGVYIKAHGSIDWYYCGDATCKAYGLFYPMLRGPKSNRPFCRVCLTRTAVLMVPPTLNKKVRDLPPLRRMWAAAANELDAATSLTIWGYSMPPTDFFSEWLLRHARSRRCSRVRIVNPACIDTSGAKPRLDSPFIERFVSALRPPGRSIDLQVYDSFADLESGLEANSKYPSLRSPLRRASRRTKASIS